MILLKIKLYVKQRYLIHWCYGDTCIVNRCNLQGSVYGCSPDAVCSDWRACLGWYCLTGSGT